MEQKMEVDITEDSGTAVVTFLARSLSDSEGIAAVSRKINSFIENEKPNVIIFDFGQVKFFSSLVLGLLLEVRARLEQLGGKVVLSAIDPQLHRVFKITNLDSVFRFFPDSDSAVKAMTSD
jgi:anti-sigma B factor antagonist